jgi:hypothetical protein
MLYSLHGETFENATTRPDPYQMTEKEAYDVSRIYGIALLVFNNPDVSPYPTTLKVSMLSGIKD